MVSLDDFKQHEGSKSTQITLNQFGVTIYFRQNNDDDKFNISGYATGFKNPTHICRVSSIEDCNDVLAEICRMLVFLSKIQSNIDMHKFFSLMHERYSPSERQRRFKDVSDDGIITVFVKKEGESWIPKVCDYKKGTKEHGEGFLSSAVPTEKEAEDICKNCLNEYNIYGYYQRHSNRQRFALEHESTHIHEDMANECYVYDNGIKTEISQEQANKIKIMIENDLI